MEEGRGDEVIPFDAYRIYIWTDEVPGGHERRGCGRIKVYKARSQERVAVARELWPWQLSSFKVAYVLL